MTKKIGEISEISSANHELFVASKKQINEIHEYAMNIDNDLTESLGNAKDDITELFKENGDIWARLNALESSKRGTVPKPKEAVDAAEKETNPAKMRRDTKSKEEEQRQAAVKEKTQEETNQGNMRRDTKPKEEEQRQAAVKEKTREEIKRKQADKARGNYFEVLGSDKDEGSSDDEDDEDAKGLEVSPQPPQDDEKREEWENYSHKNPTAEDRRLYPNLYQEKNLYKSSFSAPRAWGEARMLASRHPIDIKFSKLMI
jgi:hypothetical protein